MSVLHPIDEDPRFRVSTATEGQTAFTVPFYFQNNADVAVLLYPGGAGAGVELAEGTQYALTGAGNNAGGTVTLSTPASAGDIVIRIGRAVLDRVTDITVNGRFRSKPIDDELDRLIIIALEQARDLARAYKAPFGYTGGLIGPGNEGHVPIFDESGNLVDGPTADDIANAEDYAEQAIAAAALAQAGAGVPLFATKAVAEAYAPVAAPTFIDLAFYDTARVPGSGARYRKADAEPAHDGKLSITLTDTSVVWFELETGRDCRAYGARCDGAADDSAAVLRQYLHLHRIVLPPDSSTVLSSWSTQSPAFAVSITGERSIVELLNVSLFTLEDGAALEVRGVTFVAPAAPVVALATDANLDHFSWVDSGITGGAGITPAGAGCLDIDHVLIEGCRFSALTADLLTLKSNIKRADILRNVVDGITTAGNSAMAFLLGKTQLSDQPNTGDYSCIGNKVLNLEAQGTSAGEVHAFLLYGSRAVVADNIIRNLSRTGSGANQEGIEGIYTKVDNVVITGNVLVRAGRESGNKNAAINHKGTPLNGAVAGNPLGSYFVIANNTIVGDAAQSQSGIRTEADHGIITGNQIALCFYSINIAPSVLVENVQISNNNCNQCTGPGGIRANVVCDGLVIDGNLVEKATSPIYTTDGGDGIVLTTNSRTGDVKRSSFSNNRILGSWQYGIRTQFVSPSMCYDLHVQGNQIVGLSSGWGLRNYPDAQIDSGYVSGNLMNCSIAYRDQSTNLIYDGNYNAGVAAP